MRSRDSFNKAAQLYDEVRPSYPDVLIDWIIEKAALDVGSELLEIAPGTGQATKKFVERDYRIHAVELGDELAELLLINMKDKKVSVDVSSFEDWQPTDNKTYKLIYCATAWHWIDPQIKYKKVHDLLENNGKLALLWNNSLGSSNNKILDEAYRLLFAYHDEKTYSTKSPSKKEVMNQIVKTKDDIEESGHLRVIDYFEHTWYILESKEILIKGFYSQSSYLSLSEENKEALTPKLQALFNRLEDNIECEYRSTAYMCEKIG